MSEATYYEPHLVGLFTPSLATESEDAEAESLTQKGALNPSTHELPASVKPSFLKSAQWSADGTSLLTSGADNVLRSFILPPDLLEPPAPHVLLPYSQHRLPEPSRATAIHPSYHLAEPSTCLILVTLRDLPIRLFSPFAPDILATYPLVSPTTEAWIAPHSLVFSPNEPNTFFAGANGLIAEFDLQRNGEGPVNRTQTSRGRKRGGVHALNDEGMNGIVSAMAINADGILAAGTFTRRVGLYDGNGRGATVGTFDIEQNNVYGDDRGGLGVTQVLWSSCGRYLCVAERGSNGVSVWDIRGTGKSIAWLEGRQAKTQQRLGIDIMGGELWTGGTDGIVRVWKNVGMESGVVSPTWSFQAHDDSIGSTALHPTARVLATCSGHRNMLEPGTELEDEAAISPTSSLSSTCSETSVSCTRQHFDGSLKVWAL